MNVLKLAMPFALVAMLAACGQVGTDADAALEPAAVRCYPFTANVGGPFAVQIPPVYVTPEAEVFTRPYLEAGTWWWTGELRQQSSTLAAGDPDELIPSWINMRVVPNTPLVRAGFRFGEYYAHNNLMINGDLREVGYLADLDGQVIGGALITVTLDPVQPGGGNTGYLEMVPLAGTIDAFAMGGQELAVDDVCLQN